MKKLAVALVCIAVAVFLGVFIIVNLFGTNTGVAITYEQAVERLPSMLKNVKVSNIESPKHPIELGGADLYDELPEITKYPTPVTTNAAAGIEIFSSTEKASSGNDDWLSVVATDFNKSGFKTSSGRDMGVTVRSIASGAAVDYIVSGKYVPDAYSPSNELWGEMVRYAGVPIEMKAKRIAGNVAGILMDKNKHAEFVQKYGEINGRTITQAVEANDILMGYTNPFASSTGLNFLLSILYAYDNGNPLSETAEVGFSAFQTNVPSVAYSTLEMRDSLVERKSLDACVLEYQLYKNESKLSNYIFTPFGVRHDSPVYAIGTLSADKTETLDKFIEFCLTQKNQDLAHTKGFNYLDDYVPELSTPPANVVTQAQQLFKEKKNAGRPVAAVFIADISGSMAGEPIVNLKNSLANGIRYIDPENYIGLVSYSTDVYVNLPIRKFDINQQSLFVGAVNDFEVAGSTSTYSAVIVALDMLAQMKQLDPQVKPMIFLLSDGEQNTGYSLNSIRDVVKGMGIPIYSIGYNANLSELSEISAINEASATNAQSDDITYVIKGLFNAQM